MFLSDPTEKLIETCDQTFLSCKSEKSRHNTKLPYITVENIITAGIAAFIIIIIIIVIIIIIIIIVIIITGIAAL